MSLLRKILLSAVMSLAAITPFTHSSSAEAHPVPNQARYYAVYYRVNLDNPWYFYYSFYSAADARRYANWIGDTYGYDVYVYTVR